MSPEIAALRDHALGLADGLGVGVLEHPGMPRDARGRTSGPRAHIRQRFVSTLPIADTWTYLVCAHELGHFGRPAPGDTPGVRLLSEARAWAWALDRAVVEPDAESWAEIQRAWLGHVEHEGGDKLSAGAELVADEHLVEYLGTWVRVVAGLQVAPWPAA